MSDISTASEIRLGSQAATEVWYGSTKIWPSFTDPRSISGLYAWYDATQGLFNATSGGAVVTTNGGAIARWEDSSGNGRHLTQGTSSLMPTLLTANRNGKNVVSFNSDFLVSSANWGLGQNKVFIFYVAKWNAYDPSNINTLFDMSGSDAGQFFAMNYLGNFVLRYYTNGFWETNIPMSTFGTNWHSVASLFPRQSSGNFNYNTYVNKTLTASISANDNNINFASNRYFGIGDAVSATGAANGAPSNMYLAEIAIYLRPNNITDKDRQNMDAYFQEKWGI